MKKIYPLLLAFFAAQTAFTQIQLEHTYPVGHVWRTRLDVSGETYVLNHIIDCDVTLFDSAHTKKLHIPLSDGSSCSNYLFSEKIMDDDDGIEVLYRWFYEFDGTGKTFRDDDGTKVGLGKSGTLQLSRTPSLKPKLLSGAGVWSLPGLQFEQGYGISSNWRLERQFFPLDGERYIAYNREDFDGYHFHDGQHNWVKTVNLAHPSFDYLHDISQQYFNSDPKFEFFGTRWMGGMDANGNRQLTEVVQEDGTVLFSMGSEGHSLSSIPGLPDRLLVFGYGSPQQRQTTVLDPAALTVLHTFPGTVSRQLMPDGEEIYWNCISGDKALIYNAKYQLLKTVALPNANAYRMSITRGQFSKGNKFEFCYNLQGANLPKGVRCSDEDGNVLYEFPGAEHVWIDRQKGMADRFFVPYSTLADSTQVYKFTHSTSVSPITQTAFASVAPNPFQHSLEVQLADAGDYRLTLLNSIGQTVATQKAERRTSVSIPTHTLPPGVYWLRVEGQQQQVLRVIKAD